MVDTQKQDGREAALERRMGRVMYSLDGVHRAERVGTGHDGAVCRNCTIPIPTEAEYYVVIPFYRGINNPMRNVFPMCVVCAEDAKLRNFTTADVVLEQLFDEWRDGEGGGDEDGTALVEWADSLPEAHPELRGEDAS